MNFAIYILIFALVILLCGSVWLNNWFYKVSGRLYSRAESLRFDPYELENYPSSPNLSQRDSNKPLVVFFGDSRAAAWPAIANIPFEFINRGINGQITNQLLARIPAHIAPLSPNIVIVQVGVNDLKNVAAFPDKSQNILEGCKRNIKKIVDELTNELQATVILTTIFHAGDLSLMRRIYWSSEVDRAIVEVNQFIKSLKSDRVIIFDTATLLIDKRSITRKDYSQDYLHINSLAYTMLNHELSQILISQIC